jgi:hypothetical protein
MLKHFENNKALSALSHVITTAPSPLRHQYVIIFTSAPHQYHPRRHQYIIIVRSFVTPSPPPLPLVTRHCLATPLSPHYIITPSFHVIVTTPSSPRHYWHAITATSASLRHHHHTSTSLLLRHHHHFTIVT